MRRYLARMERRSQERGVACPLLLMMSSGGICTVETARRFPVRLVESGPAGGAILARHVAARGGSTARSAFDMGGTTAKITLIDDFTPQQSRHFEVARAYRFAKGSGFPGAHPGDRHGGDRRRRRLDRARRFAAPHRVGPGQRGLASPAPPATGAAARSRRSPMPTSCSAASIRRGSPAARSRSTRCGRCRRVDRDDRRAAGDAGARRRAASPRSSTRRWPAPRASMRWRTARTRRGRTLIAFGGAAPLHAARLAQKLGIRASSCRRMPASAPRSASSRAPIAYEVVRTLLVRLDALEQAHARRAVRRDARRGRSGGAARRARGSAGRNRTGFMRYRGQGHEIAVPLPAGTFGSGARRCVPRSMRRYTRCSAASFRGLEVEAVTWTLSLGEPHDSADSRCRCRRDAAAAAAQSAAPHRSTPASGEMRRCALFDRAPHCRAAQRLTGPAVIVEDGTTTIVPSWLRPRASAPATTS